VFPNLMYPPPPSKCGCTDPNYLEFNPIYTCNNTDSCKRKIVFGCMDSKACNYNSTANWNLPNLCCYPGSCADRDISLVCPDLGDKLPIVSIFPNPAIEKLEVSLSNIEIQNTTLSIFDVYGKKYWVKKIDNSVSEFDISTLAKGMYILRVQNNEKIYTKYLVKN